MSIMDLCISEVVTALERTSLQDIAALMKARSVGMVVVTDCRGNPTGVVTDRDIVISCVVKNLDMSLEPVETAMCSEVVAVKSDSGIVEVIKLMEDRKIRRVLVTGGDGRICGVVSTDDLMRLVASEMTRIGSLYLSQTGTSARHRTHEFTRMA